MTMIRPTLRRLHSPDAYDLEKFSPRDPDNFSLLIQAMFGPEGGEGEESFDIVVCTPAWLANEIQRSGIVIGRHLLIVAAFDFQQIRSRIESFAASCAGETWDEVGEKLSRLGKWEFEDYRP